MRTKSAFFTQVFAFTRSGEKILGFGILYVESFINGAFELRRHKCADAASQVAKPKPATSDKPLY